NLLPIDDTEISASIHHTGQITSYAVGEQMILRAPNSILIDGSIFLRRMDSELRVESLESVRFSTGFVEAQDSVKVYAGLDSIIDGWALDDGLKPNLLTPGQRDDYTAQIVEALYPEGTRPGLGEP